MTPGILSLTRTEVRRVAAVLEVLKGRYGSTPATARALGLGQVTVQKILGKPAALRVVRGTLAAIAAAVGPGATVEQLLAGKLQPAGEAPRPLARTQPTVVVRNGRGAA